MFVANHMNTYTEYAIAYSEAGHFQERTGLAASCTQNDLVCMYRSHRGCTSHSRELHERPANELVEKTRVPAYLGRIRLWAGLHIGERLASSFCKSCSSLRGVQVEIFRGVARAVACTVGPCTLSLQAIAPRHDREYMYIG